jgi:oxygen-dependent protoporphyrinogen oxidase
MTVSHHVRVARVRRAIASVPGLEVAGAAYQGIGIPAVIASAHAAAEATATHLRAVAEHAGE